MAASARVTSNVDAIVELFNRRRLDLPDGFFNRHTQFLLNGVAFEEMLGRSPSDPLILMLTRGPAGYRFTAKALQHAVPDAAIRRGELEEKQDAGHLLINGPCWLSGHLRGTGEAVEMVVDVEMRVKDDTVERVNVVMDTDALERLRAARARP